MLQCLYESFLTFRNVIVYVKGGVPLVLGSIGSRDRRPFSPPHIGRLAKYSIKDAGILTVLDSGGARENKIVHVACVHPSFRE